MDASKLPKLKSAETNTDGRPKNLPGIYKHKDNGQVCITPPGEEGTIYADYLMSPAWEHAWERTGDVPSRQELLKMNKVQEMKDKIIDAEQQIKDAAEMEALEAKIKAESKGKTDDEVDNPAPGTGVSF